MKAFLDTHAAALMVEGDRSVFGAGALDLLDRATLLCSPVVRLELAFLREIGRIQVEPDAVLGTLRELYGVSESSDPLDAVVQHALPLTWTRDPYDRLLVATARLHRAPFISRDAHIAAHYADTAW